MHLLCRADDGIYRAGLYAQCAANASLLVDDGHRLWFLDSVFSRKWFEFTAEQIGQFMYAFVASGWALVDLSLAFGYGSGVWLAPRKAALPALCLRQDGIYLLYQRIAFDAKSHRSVAQGGTKQDGAEGHDQKRFEHDLLVLVQAGEAHEGQAHQACSNHGNCCAAEVNRDIGGFKALPDTGKQYQRQCKTNGAAEAEQQ